jgi:P pilus assembly chaperone PapD
VTTSRVRSLAAVLAIAAALPAAAAAQMSIEASPLRVEVQAIPGASNTQAITLTNVGTQTVRVRASLSDWHLSRDGAPQFEEPVPDRPYAASSWVRFAPPELVIEGGRQATVRFTVTVPSIADPAGYRTGILFDFTPEERDASTRSKQVTVRSRIATLIYVHVARPGQGPPPASVELTDLKVRATNEETQIVATLKNTSRRSVRTKGSLVVYDRSGLALREVPVPDVPVLPESEREVVVPAVPAGDAVRTLAPGDYRVELKIDVGQAALIVGETTLKVER